MIAVVSEKVQRLLAKGDPIVKINRSEIDESEVKELAMGLGCHAAYFRAEYRWGFSKSPFHIRTHGHSCKVLV